MIWPQRKLFPGCVSLQDRKKQLLYNVFRKSLKFRVCIHVSRQLAWNLEVLVGVKLDKECFSPEIICENCARSTKNVVNKVFKQGSNLPCGEANCSDLLKFRGLFLKWNNLQTVCGLMESVKRPTKDSSDQFHSKRKAIMFNETSITAQPFHVEKSTEKSTQPLSCLSWPDISAIYVRLCFWMVRCEILGFSLSLLAQPLRNLDH